MLQRDRASALMSLESLETSSGTSLFRRGHESKLASLLDDLASMDMGSAAYFTIAGQKPRFFSS